MILYIDLLCYVLLIALFSVAFFVGNVGFSILTVTSPMNRNNFPSPFLIYIPFISFSCLITLSRASDG